MTLAAVDRLADAPALEIDFGEGSGGSSERQLLMDSYSSSDSVPEIIDLEELFEWGEGEVAMNMLRRAADRGQYNRERRAYKAKQAAAAARGVYLPDMGYKDAMKRIDAKKRAQLKILRDRHQKAKWPAFLTVEERGDDEEGSY